MTACLYVCFGGVQCLCVCLSVFETRSVSVCLSVFEVYRVSVSVYLFLRLRC